MPTTPWAKVPGNPTCVATGCTKELCCVCLTTTPCTTTTHLTCSSFTCPPAPWTKVPGNPTCVATGCTKELCCVCLTTTPCTTTTHSTCSSFTCPPAPWTKMPGDPVCAATGCTKELCCACLTTTPAPASPCTTAAAASPCTTHAMRLYSAQEGAVLQKTVVTEKDTNTSKASLTMVMGMFALFAVGGVAVAAVVRKVGRRNTRHVNLIEPSVDDDALE